ncbi:glycine/D-amino acid oxidase, deaminating [Caulobacter sp. AP07]|uniref:NAD(P)/FAD-dependent oxidoreductase n=1 Tax=Caulobacter sp. AP07 TaxID=1144304 RepID=UPI000271EDE7|nr:FAD-binding oxidoreductase [Caulobacter sp. AP07]EJL30815.1 glycine/D-amino acid oxidase, deaminating [Caulobacter sp. AP07]
MKISRRGALVIGAASAAAAVGSWRGLGLHKPGGAIVKPGVGRARSVRSDAAAPAVVDVVVIGGGNIGCAAGLTLAERGLRVAICEKGVIAGEASGRSVGYVDSQFLDPAKMEIIGRSKALWRTLNQRVAAETGYRQTGLVSVFETQAALAEAQAWLASVKGAPGVDARIISGSQLDGLLPRSGRRWAGAMFQPSDGSAEPTLFAPSLADAARRHGAVILQNCAVRGLQTAAGRVSGVVTERGPIAAQAVILAGGAWSPLMARSLGLDLGQFDAHASVARMAGVRDGPAVSAWGPDYCWRPQIDGGYTLAAITGVAPITPALLANSPRLLPAMRRMWGEVLPVFNGSTFLDQLTAPAHWALDAPSPFERNRILTPEVRRSLLDAVAVALKAKYPVFAPARIVEAWGGVISTTLDNMPIISAVTQTPGLYLGTGFYYGLTMAPAAGEALADLVTGQRPAIDLSAFQHQRFSDGSPVAFRA